MSGDVTSAEFKAALSALTDEDARTRDNALDSLLANSQTIQAKVISRLRDETDSQVRSILLELLGASQNPKHIPVLEKALWTSKGIEVFGAFVGLQRMDREDATQITKAWLVEARKERRRKRPPR